MFGGVTAPVALFVYRRPDHTRRALADLRAMPESTDTDLYVFSDAPATAAHRSGVDAVRAVCRECTGFRQLRLVERPHNLGCAGNVIDGVSQVLATNASVIVIEDDLRLSVHLLHYLNRALGVYRQRPDIFSVSAFSAPPEQLQLPKGYAEDVYLSRRNASWGWATWADRWQRVDWELADYAAFRRDRARRRGFDQGGGDLSRMLDEQMAGRLDSWAIRFSYAHFVQQAYSLCPRWSYTDHAGDDGSGTHVPRGGGCRVDLSRALAAPRLPLDLQPDAAVLRVLRDQHREHWLGTALGRLPGVRPLVRRLKRSLGITGRLL
jgi:hypothetical protein